MRKVRVFIIGLVALLAQESDGDETQGLVNGTIIIDSAINSTIANQTSVESSSAFKLFGDATFILVIIFAGSVIILLILVFMCCPRYMCCCCPDALKYCCVPRQLPPKPRYPKQPGEKQRFLNHQGMSGWEPAKYPAGRVDYATANWQKEVHIPGVMQTVELVPGACRPIDSMTRPLPELYNDQGIQTVRGCVPDNFQPGANSPVFRSG